VHCTSIPRATASTDNPKVADLANLHRRRDSHSLLQAFEGRVVHCTIKMLSHSLPYSFVLLLFTLLHSSAVRAAVHANLPHEVLNFTQSMGVPQPVEITITQSYTVNYTATELTTTTQQCPTPSSTRTIYSIVFPSPDAAPIEVTAQSQVLTSYIPEMTWCVAPPLQYLPISGAPYLNATTNHTTTVTGTGSCETVYAPLETTVCATTLTGLASKVTITDCSQEVTFSTECGFTLETPTPTKGNNTSMITPAPTVRQIFTYYVAPWQSMTAGETPSDVDVKICKVLDNGDLECSRFQEVWEVVVVTSTLTTTHPIAFTATVSGPGTLIVETLQAIVTDTITTLGLSTTLLLETEIETESTSTRRKTSASGTSTVNGGTSTLFLTKTVHQVRRYVSHFCVEIYADNATALALKSLQARCS
jgi:hypothetical protein